MIYLNPELHTRQTSETHYNYGTTREVGPLPANLANQNKIMLCATSPSVIDMYVHVCESIFMKVSPVKLNKHFSLWAWVFTCCSSQDQTLLRSLSKLYISRKFLRDITSRGGISFANINSSAFFVMKYLTRLWAWGYPLQIFLFILYIRLVRGCFDNTFGILIMNSIRLHKTENMTACIWSSIYSIQHHPSLRFMNIYCLMIEL